MFCNFEQSTERFEILTLRFTYVSIFSFLSRFSFFLKQKKKKKQKKKLMNKLLLQTLSYIISWKIKYVKKKTNEIMKYNVFLCVCVCAFFFLIVNVAYTNEVQNGRFFEHKTWNQNQFLDRSFWHFWKTLQL